MTRLEAIGWQHGFQESQLHADPNAVTFYERAGYRPIASDIHHDHDGVAMLKRQQAQRGALVGETDLSQKVEVLLHLWVQDGWRAV